MKISTKGRYALRLLLDIAQQGEGAVVSLKEISSTWLPRPSQGRLIWVTSMAALALSSTMLSNSARLREALAPILPTPAAFTSHRTSGRSASSSA